VAHLLFYSDQLQTIKKKVMKTLSTKQTVKSVSILILSLVVFGTSLLAQPTFLNDEVVIENEIQVENWMTDYDTFDSNFNEEMYTEEDLEIQAWMLNIDEITPVTTENYNEDLLAIEDWMVNYSAFTNETEEPLLAIEDWMLNYNDFEQASFDIDQLVAEQIEDPMQVEAWMTCMEVFNESSVNFIPSIKTVELDAEPVLIALHQVK